MNSHAQTGNGRQVQPIRVSYSAHTVLSHGVNGAVAIPQNDRTFLMTKTVKSLMTQSLGNKSLLFFLIKLLKKHLMYFSVQSKMFGINYLAGCEDCHITLALSKKGQITGGKVIFLLRFTSGQIKDTIPYPTARF